MDWLQALLLGLLQGLTEYLPVSSSGHLQLGQRLLEVNPNAGGLMFDVVVHVATVLSTLVVLHKEVLWVFKGLFKPLKPVGTAPQGHALSRLNDEQRYCVYILISMVPIAIVGLLMKDWIEAAFNGVHVVGVCLLVTASLLMMTAYYKPKQHPINATSAFWIGVAQAIAVLPGLSRSGSTIATGLLLGNRREDLAQFSFLMVIPPILGEALLDFRHIFAPSAEYLATHGATEAIGAMPMLVGFLAAFVSGCVACKWMVELVKKCKLQYFAFYCFVVGILALIYA